MLSNPSDYKFVDVSPVAGMIDGNIIPKSISTCSIAPLRFENYLWCLEGWYERQNPEQAGTNSIAVPSTALSRGNINAIAISELNNHIRGPNIGYKPNVTEYLSLSTVVSPPHAEFVSQGSPQYGLYDFLQDSSLSAPEQHIPYYRMRPITSYPPVLYIEFMKAKFWTLNNMRKLLMPLAGGDFATSIVQQTLDKNGNVKNQSTVYLDTQQINVKRAWIEDSLTHEEYQSLRTVATLRDTFYLQFPYASTAKLVWNCFVLTEPAYGSGKHIWASMDINVSEGNLQVPSGLIDGIFDDACSYAGMDNKANVSLRTLYLLIDFDFPATLDGLQWGWKPTYT